MSTNPVSPVHSMRTLFQRCLQAKGSDRLLVLYDESFQGLVPTTIEATLAIDLPTALFNVPLAYQRHLVDRFKSPERLELPPAYQAAIQESTVILTAVDGGLETSRFRGALIGLTRPKGCRLAHVPGFTEELLAVVGRSPFEQILRWSDEIGWAMGEARAAEIITIGLNGVTHRLAIPLDGWDNEPLLSTGVIAPDSWGNVPPAEVFCCPRPWTAAGSVVINGSVQNHVFGGSEEVVLTFEEGRLVRWSGDPSTDGIKFFEDTKAKCLLKNDPNWNALAEFGIGLNPAFEHLTGNSLLDEKVAGTIHVAIGDNFHFGHAITASIHADLVTWKPTVTFDEHPVLSAGRICSEEIETWRAQSTEERKEPLPAGGSLRKSRAVVKEGILYRRVSRGQRFGELHIADQSVSRALAGAYSELSTYGPWIDLHRFSVEHPHFNGIESTRLLKMLHHLRILDCEGRP